MMQQRYAAEKAADAAAHEAQMSAMAQQLDQLNAKRFNSRSAPTGIVSGSNPMQTADVRTIGGVNVEDSLLSGAPQSNISTSSNPMGAKMEPAATISSLPPNWSEHVDPATGGTYIYTAPSFSFSFSFSFFFLSLSLCASGSCFLHDRRSPSITPPLLLLLETIYRNSVTEKSTRDRPGSVPGYNEWEEHHDEKGTVFYNNSITGKTRLVCRVCGCLSPHRI
jgi:hypothetical protein